MSSPLGGLPQLPMIAGARFTAAWAGWFSTVQNILTATSSSGATTARPTTGQYVGMFYFDTTLGKPVWLKTPGSSPVWVDATGTPA
jgi:hypothetical protein